MDGALTGPNCHSPRSLYNKRFNIVRHDNDGGIPFYQAVNPGEDISPNRSVHRFERFIKQDGVG